MYSTIKLLYANINSYSEKRHLINHYIENNDIKCTLFVETKAKPHQSLEYRDWTILKKYGNILNRNVRGGSLIQASKEIKLGKANPPSINNPANDTLHCTIPFLDDKLHIFLSYIHPNSIIEENIFIKAVQYKYVIIIGDFNIHTNTKKKQLQQFLANSSFTQIWTPPTFLMDNNPDSTPDIILCTENIKNHLSASVIPDLTSDHLAIELILDCITQVNTSPETKRKNYNLCNIQKVNEELILYISQNIHTTTTSISEFLETLSQLTEKYSPTTKQKYLLHTLPPYILRMIKKEKTIIQRNETKHRLDTQTEI